MHEKYVSLISDSVIGVILLYSNCYVCYCIINIIRFTCTHIIELIVCMQ